MSAPRVPDAILWHEGMMLSPQHFQQQDRRAEALLAHRLEVAAPHAWGVLELQYDKAALVNGLFRVTLLRAVLPDGMAVVHSSDPQDGCPEQTLEIDLTQSLEEIKAKPQRIHLAVPVPASDGTLSVGDSPRFLTAEGPEAVDEHAADGRLRVPRLVPNLRLLVSNQPSRRFVALPLAEVEFRNETFSPTAYVPPAPAVDPGSRLGALCLGVAERMRQKAVMLSERIQATVREGGVVSNQDQAMIHAMVTALPRFEVAARSRTTHPEALYAELAGIVGQVATMTESMMPPVLPLYAHDNPWPAFDSAARYIHSVMERVSETYVAVAFDRGQAAFSLFLRDRWLRPGLTIGLRHGTSMTQAEAVSWLESCLIGSASSIPDLESRRILGAPRRLIERDDDLQVVPGRGMLLFAIETGRDFIRAGEPLVIAQQDARRTIQPSEIMLFVPPG